MTGLIPDNVLEDILSRIDIVEVISGFIPLKRAGRNFKTTCPFHHEKTPSFTVSPDRQIYHCFGCGESGNAFKFLMRFERLEFPEAVESLAKKAGVILPEAHKQDPRVSGMVTQLYKINELAVAFYENNLNSGDGLKAKEYFAKRGIKPETIKEFKLGVALDKWDALINYLRSKNISLALLEKAGLVLAKDAGGFYDRFRNRLIFPIFDIKSRPIGFGARVFDDTLPKYINSPETQIYTKGKNLYGLNSSRDSIREIDSVVIVEGYLDCIIPYQEGLKNIVASQGTALTIEQVRLLKRYTHNVVMVYDPDSAGELAALRSLDIFIEEEMSVKIVALMKGFDPDSFVRKFGILALKEKIDSAVNLFDYKLNFLKSLYNSKDVEGRVKISSAMLQTLVKIKNAVLKSEYIKRLAQELDVSEQALLAEAKKINAGSSAAGPERPIAAKAHNINPTEKLLIKLMLEEKELIERIKENLEPADFEDATASRIVSVMFDLVMQGKNVEPSILMNYLRDEDMTQVICETMFMPEGSTSEHKEKVVDDCIRTLKARKLVSKRQHLHNAMKQAEKLGDDDELHRLMEEFHHLIKQR